MYPLSFLICEEKGITFASGNLHLGDTWMNQMLKISKLLSRGENKTGENVYSVSPVAEVNKSPLVKGSVYDNGF